MLKLRTLLALVFGLVFAIVVARSVATVRTVQRILAEDRALVDQTLQTASAIDRVAALAGDLETGVRGWLLTHDTAFRAPYNRAVRDRAGALTVLERQVRGDPAHAATAARVRELVDAWDRDVATPQLDPARVEPSAADARALHAEGKRRMDAIRGELAALRDGVAVAHAAAMAAFDTRRDALATQQYVGAIGVALVLVVVALFMARVITQPLARVVAHGRRVAQGDYAPVTARGVAELRELARAASEMAASLAAERARGRSLTSLMSALAEGGDASDVARAALRALMDDTGARGGVLWVARTPDGPLEPLATVAIDAAALTDASASLARQARASGRVVRVDDVGAASVHVIRSAFADVAPRALLAAPLATGTTVVGVVELAGAPAERVDLDEITRGSARIALALANALAAERTATLLAALAAEQAAVADANETLRSQNHELQAQEEELRAQAQALAAQQAELALHNDELARASRTKNDFLANMSHELRTPLNAVIGFSELMRDGHYGALTPAQRAPVGDVLTAARQLLLLINDVLDLAKIEAGRVDLRVGAVDLAAVTTEACDLVSTLADQKKLVLANRVPAGVLASADADKTRQVLLNLLSNAVKFTPAGGAITVTTSLENSMVRTEVRDTGIGIAAADLPRLFQPFSQLDTGDARHFGGTGLGLSICKRLVELMGGVVGACSTPREGSTFFFTLPTAAAGDARAPGSLTRRASAPEAPRPAPAQLTTTGPAAAAPTATTARPLVLVLEDDDASARLLEAALNRGGYAVRRVHTGDAAMSALAETPPTLLIADLVLPGEPSGHAVIQRLRGAPATRELPVIVLTARDLSAAERDQLVADADVVLQKGAVSASELVAHVAALCPPAVRPRTLALIVDDSALNRRVLRASLATAGCEALEAEDAAVGMRLARSAAPAFILLDIEMPGIDGLEATRRLKADPATRAIPVIAVSAHAMIGDADRAIAAGCAAYVTKPIARAEVFAAIDRALGAATWRAT